MSQLAGGGPLFVYGTLLFPEVLRALLDRVPSRMPAAAPGWRVAALPGKVYPGLVPGARSAPGLLMTGLTAEEWRILVAFEGDRYDLRWLSLSGDRGGWAFVLSDSSAASPQDWVPEEFAERVLPSYVESCAAWRRRHRAVQAASRSVGC